MSEADLQSSVIDLARRTGWLHMHIRDSRKSSGVGFPDLVLVHRDGRLLFVELKSATGRPTAEQLMWLNRLGIHHEAHLWRPAHWLSGEIQRVLMGEAVAA